MSMASLEKLAQAAGLHTLETRVVIPNFELPLIDGSSQPSQNRVEPLFCNVQFGGSADLTLLYFVLPDCENCRLGVTSIDHMSERVFTQPLAQRVKVCARVVVSDWPTPDEVAQEFRSLELHAVKGIVWDAQGVLNERLAVVGQPAFFMLDKKGQVLAYQNGPVEFGSPGFEVFLQSLLNVLKGSTSKEHPADLAKAFSLEQEELSRSHVRFLDQTILSMIWLAVLVALCYAFGRFFLRLRKNLSGS